MKWFVYVMAFITTADAFMSDWISGDWGQATPEWTQAYVWQAAALVLAKLYSMVGGRYD